MIRPVRFFPAVLALAALVPILPAQQDCTPTGPASQQKAICAINHAQYLYAQECGNRPVCDESPQLVAAYALAADLFDRWSNALPLQADYNERMRAEVRDALRRAVLAERAHRFAQAAELYHACINEAGLAKPPYAEYQNYCVTDLNRLRCAIPHSAVCNAPSGEQTVVYRTVSSGGGVAASALDSDGNIDDPSVPLQAIQVKINSPAPADILTLQNAMSDRDRAELARTLAEHKISITAH